MKALNSRMACFLLAIILLFAGMCSGILEADSFFAYNINQPQRTVLSDAGAVRSESMSFTYETISAAREVLAFTGMARRICLRIGTRVPVVLSGAEVLARLLILYLVTVGAIIAQMISSEAVILRFIHHQDGEK